MCESVLRAAHPIRAGVVLRNWTCRLCSHSNPDSETICCQQCGAAKK